MDVDPVLLAKVYQESYFKGEEYLDYVQERDALQYNFSRRLQNLQKFAKFKDGESVLEIGCAYGFFGDVLLKRYPTLHYLGLDVVPEACAYARKEMGLNIECADFLSLDLPSIRGPFDHVFMWDVIEHLPEPDRYLEKIASVVAESGFLYLTTGDISGLLPRLQGARWRMIHPPSHLHYFSKRSLSRLLDKYGFAVRSIQYPATARSLKQMFYLQFGMKERASAWKRWIYQRIPEKMQVALNTFDIMLVIAQKS